MSTVYFPRAPPPPRATYVFLPEELPPLDFQHQLLSQAQRLRKVEFVEKTFKDRYDVEYAASADQLKATSGLQAVSDSLPPPPPAMRLERGINLPGTSLRDQLKQTRQHIKASRVPVAPLPPPAMRLTRGFNLTGLSLREQLKAVVLKLRAKRLAQLLPPPPPAMRLERGINLPGMSLREELKPSVRKLKAKRIPPPPPAMRLTRGINLPGMSLRDQLKPSVRKLKAKRIPPPPPAMRLTRGINLPGTSLRDELKPSVRRLKAKRIPPPPPAMRIERGINLPGMSLRDQLKPSVRKLKAQRIPPPPPAMRVERGINLPGTSLRDELKPSVRKLKAKRMPEAPPRPLAMRLERGVNLPGLSLRDQLKPSVRKLKSKRMPAAPPAPPAANLRLAPAKPLNELLASAVTERADHSRTLPENVQREFLEAAKDKHRSMTERDVPLAPAAPAPVLNAVPPLHHTIPEEAAEAALEKSRAHYPPMAPAAPAPDLIPRDAVLERPLKEELVPIAVKAIQHVPALVIEPKQQLTTTSTFRGVPDAPPAPGPFQVYRPSRMFTLNRPFKDELADAVRTKMSRRDDQMREAQRSFAAPPPLPPRPVEMRVPKQHKMKKVAPPLPPRPAETLALMANMRGNAVVHAPEVVINHAPLMEKEVIEERPVEIKVEHHIQPVVHEVEHRIQPIIKTEATTERTIIVQDKNVMLPPIIEPPVVVSAGLPTTATMMPTRAATTVASPVMTTPLTMATPVSPSMATTMTSPVMATPLTMATPMTTATPVSPAMAASLLPSAPVMATPMATGGMLDAEQRLGLGAVAPLMSGEREIMLERPTMGTTHHHAGAAPVASSLSPTSSTSATTTNRGRRGSIGMKIKGAMKEVQGTLTRNPAKKEEGKMLLHGIDPATSSSHSSSRI